MVAGGCVRSLVLCEACRRGVVNTAGGIALSDRLSAALISSIRSLRHRPPEPPPEVPLPPAEAPLLSVEPTVDDGTPGTMTIAC
jgi:hypothetical protein